ncbi:MAG: tetratricopeptide repeat protein, partial [Anaerolineae bacterium]|nr:tetratricopeptide repeat protein [Anaerolineae bacterium]
MQSINPHLVNLLVVLLYILLFGGLSLVRREGLSTRFAVESLVLGGGIVAASLAAGAPASPILLLVALYVVTMRSRWLTELANLLGQRGQFGVAHTLYGLALRLWPDTIGRRLVLLNRGALWIRAGNPQAACETFEPLLREDLSPRHTAAAHYNLGIAYERLGQGDKAVRHFHAAMEAMPGSLYALGTEAALRRRRKAAAPPEKPEGEGDEGDAG